MALAHTTKWIVRFGHRLDLGAQGLLTAAVKADIKEARPTVRAKRPVQQPQLEIAARAVMDAWDNPDDSALANGMVSLRKALQHQAVR